MKKILLFAATATMLFAACTNEDLVAPQTGAETALEDGAVGFDVYVPGATAQTRAGRTNVMTTKTMQQTGFGIFGYQTDEEKTNFAVAGYVSGTSKPNYMWNQQVNYSASPSAWYYSPLKYWPNETNNDLQSAMMPDVSSHNHLDRLTFFAYAPWVNANSADGGRASNVNNGVGATGNNGIFRLTNQDGKLDTDGSYTDAQIAYVVATDPNESVDLLWGVAPAGGISYKNVTGSTTTIPEGKPLIDLVKPAVNTSLKFQFQHALARFGVKVVLAADQVAPGGNFDYANTKVTIEKIELKSKGFGTSGILNLNNSVAFEPNWKKKNMADGTTGNPVLTIEKGKGLAEHLCYDETRKTANEQQKVTGVTTDQADAIQVTSKYDAQNPDYYVSAETKPGYSPIKPFFKAQGDVVRTGGAAPSYATYKDWQPTEGLTYLQKCVTNNGVAYTDITKTINATYPTATVWKEIYTLDHAIKVVTAENREAVAALTAYRLVGKTYTATGQKPEIGDYVFWTGYAAATPEAVKAPEYTGTYYAANPNYFMVIPYNGATDEYKKISVKITYYVSTTDANVANKVVYTKNEVEKDVVLPHLKNGVAYDLRLILGLTSVKVEADVADWTTTGVEVNLPQNISE